MLLEEKEQNRMAESLVLFESVINSRWFLRTSIILFLNKIDVFKAKLPKVRGAGGWVMGRDTDMEMGDRCRWTSISPSILVDRISIRRPSTSSGDSHKPTGPG